MGEDIRVAKFGVRGGGRTALLGLKLDKRVSKQTGFGIDVSLEEKLFSGPPP